MKKVSQNGLSKAERLSGHTEIRNLFENGFSFFYYPFRILTMVRANDESAPLQLLVSVSKKNFKKAISRNRIKRLTRESFRQNKQMAANTAVTHNLSVMVALIYTPKELPDFHQLNTRMAGLMAHLSEKLPDLPVARKTEKGENKNISSEHTENTDKTL